MKIYQGYKSSTIEWFGEIPCHWNIVSTQYLFDICSGSTPKSNNDAYWNGEIVWITPADYNTSDHYILNGKRNITQEGYASCSTELVPKGSIVFSKRAPIGKVAIAAVDLCTNQGCLCCIPKKGVNSNYFYYLMSIQDKYYNRLGSGSTFLEISAKNFAEYKLLLPPISEQLAIATYLDEKTAKIDALIAEKKQQVDGLQAYRTSVITEAVTRGLNPNAPLRPSGIDWLSDIPEHWSLLPLKYLLETPLMYGANESPEDDVKKDHPRYIRITDIAENGDLRDETYRTLDPIKATPYLLRKGDILFARSGATVGKTYRFNEDYMACFAGYLIKATCNNHLMSKFLLYYTNSLCYSNWKNSIFDQSTIQNIAADKYNILLTPVPPISEQQEIVSYLDEKISKIDELINELNLQLDELAEYKQAVISEAVTGKVDVRDYKSNH